jgi:hypothetical protein
MCLSPALSPFTDKTSLEAKQLSELPGTPVGMSMSTQNNLSTFRYGLWRSMGIFESQQ